MISQARPTEFFELPAKAVPDHLSIGSFGEAMTGKTTFAITMPDPIAVIPLDRKTRPRLQQANQIWGKKLLFPKEDFILHKKPFEVQQMKVEEATKYYREFTDRMLDAIYTLAERPDVRSVVIDPGTQLYEDFMMRHFGRNRRILPRDRGPLNADLRDIFNALSGKHLLVPHQATEVYRNDKATGRFKPAGWAKLDYYVNVVIEHQYDERTREYSATVRMCQEQADQIGEKLVNGDVTFTMLAEMICPGNDWT